MWYCTGCSTNATSMPGRPASMTRVRSVSLGSSRNISTSDESPVGSGTASANTRASPVLPGEVRNISDGPDTPRASKFTVTVGRADGLSSSRTQACMPSRPTSSASVISTTRSLRSGGPSRIARTASRIAATDAMSSAAPGPLATES